MKKLLIREDGHVGKFRVFLLVLVVLVMIFVASTLTISVRYQISPYFTANLIVRQAFLSVVDASTFIYDPSSTQKALLGPDTGKQQGYLPVEEFPRKADLGEHIRVKEISNEKIKRSRFDFSYQTYEEPKLAELRKEYKLDDVVAPGRDEFEAMVLLRNWARSQFRRDDYQPLMKNFNALEVLRKNVRNVRNEPHKITQYRPCIFFPLFYLQILLSMGYQARLICISHLEDQGYNGHGITEVWSNQFRKWVTMDADLNLHYERDGIPLNALEVHNERYRVNPSNIKIIRTVQNSGDNEHLKEIKLGEMIDYHSYIQIVDMRNDLLTNHYFRGHPKRSEGSRLSWVDEKLPKVFDLKPKTSNPDDFYWTLNQTEIWTKKEMGGEKAVPLVFKTFTPNYSHFEIWLDDSKKISSEDPIFIWELHSGRNKLLVQSVNKFGIHGIPSFVEISVDKALQ